MAINKVVYGGSTLIDLTGDTLDDAAKLLSGVTAHGKDGSQLTGTCDYDVNSTETTKPITAARVRSGYIGFVNGAKITGTMASRGTAGVDIADLNPISKSAGYYSAGTQQIDPNEATKIISANIKNGVTILGVTGSLKDSEHYAYGYKTMTANASFEVTGIVDQQGTTFTPKGYIFVISPNVTGNTDITGSSSGNDLVICYYDKVNNKMNRNIVWSPAYTFRCNPSASSGSVGSGTFKQTASSNVIYNCMGQRYFWLAWG